MNVGTVLKGEHGQRISAAVVEVARKVEDNVCRVVTAAVNQAPSRVPGSLSIKQVRRASGKLLATKPVAATANVVQHQQPHISVAVAPLGGAQPSKWEDESATTITSATRGAMMIDTGAAVTLVTKDWTDAHGLKVSAPSGVAIRGAAGHAVEVVGVASMIL